MNKKQEYIPVMNKKQEYIPVRMVLYKLDLASTFLNTSPSIQSGIDDYEYQEEDNV